uniref:Uncharacterized protein n=1 Tax=Siphoviridae sp. ctqSm5 TaxID=2827949 RepID=A0A8S5SQF3_9CAUD|nr:MAG TPA: hypothetical protein [Siphoviridae sp. ctqSm5]
MKFNNYVGSVVVFYYPYCTSLFGEVYLTNSVFPCFSYNASLLSI